MPTIGNLICLTPRDSYVVDEPIRRRGLLGRLERATGPFVRSPGIGFPYLIGFLRKNGVLSDGTRVVVQHDKIEGATPFHSAFIAKDFVCKLERAHLRICNAVVIDDVLLSKAFDLFFQPGGL